MDEVVLALEGAIAPMDCFVDDRDEPRAVLARGRQRPACATKLLWTRVQVRRHRSLQRTDAARELVDVRRRAARARSPPPCRGLTSSTLQETMADLEIKQPPRRAPATSRSSRAST